MAVMTQTATRNNHALSPTSAGVSAIATPMTTPRNRTLTISAPMPSRAG
jgi:hypothetical protein